MNFQVDVIIIGDSKSGHDILDKLALHKPAIKIAFISKTFKSTTAHDYVNVKYFREEVEYVSYRHRLFCCYTKSGDNVFSTHLVIASGLDYEPLLINNEPVIGVFNNLDDIPKTAKDQPAVVICNQDSDAKFAMEVAKKYKQVYICTKATSMSDVVSSATAKKLDKIDNIVVLTNTSISKVTLDKNSRQKIEFDNYSEVNCSAIYAKTPATPAIDFIPKKLLAREDGYPIVTESCESTLVPGCFVAGNSLKKYTKSMEQCIIGTILKDF
jgi:thioredoxin reductase